MVPRSGQMASTFTHVAAVAAGLAIVATGFTVMPRKGLLKGTALAIALALTAAVLITAARQFG
jgi:hypothetical protein